MRLELKPLVEAHSSAQFRWVLEWGRKTLGRSPECDWQLPADQRSVSKLHCVIERQGNAFVLIDRSSNGSRVDGGMVQDGATAHLRHGSRIELGTVAIEVEIKGAPNEATPDPDQSLAMSDEALTISSILADVAPGGQMASGILGPREIDETFSAPRQRRSSVKTSRNVEIGWQGPPDPKSEAKIIPEDWLHDPTSELGDTLEHGGAPRVSIAVARARSADSQARQDFPTSDMALPALDDQTQLSPSPAEIASTTADTLLRRIEGALEASRTLLGMAGDQATANDHYGSAEPPAIDDRLTDILSTCIEVQIAVERMMTDSSRWFDPRVIEARVDSRNRAALPWFQEGRYWRAYKAQFDLNGKQHSTADILRKSYLPADRVDPSTPANLPEKGSPSNEE